MSLATQFESDPRFSIEEAATELTIQTAVDELRLLEYGWQGMAHPSLLDASGKQSLGGGEFVGITYQGRNALLGFSSVRTAVQSGTATTASSAPIQSTFPNIRLIDISAMFESNGVQLGAAVINFTDESISDVLEVISQTELRVTVPVNGTDNDFAMSDSYGVFNWNRRVIRAGNTTAVDELFVTLDPVMPTFGTHLVIEKSTSAAMLNPDSLDDIHGQVQRSIFIDTELVLNGNGYQQTPYNNWSDAIDDAETNNIKSLVVLADATVDRQIKNFVVMGVGKPTIDLNGQNVDKSEFHSCDLTGAMTGEVTARDCALVGVTGIDGHFSNCDLQGVNEIATAGEVVFDSDPHSSVAGLGRPIFSMNASSTGAKLSMRGYSGGLTLTNCNHADDAVTLEFAQGKCTLDATCTLGTISVRGVAQLLDNSAGSTVDITALLDTERAALGIELLESDQVFDQTGGLLHYYRKGTTTDLIPAKTVITTQTQDTSLTE
jgi:hypothetical protein